MAPSSSSLRFTAATLAKSLSANVSLRNQSQTRSPATLINLRRPRPVTNKPQNFNPSSPTSIRKIPPISASLFSTKSPPDSSRSNKIQELHIYEIIKKNRSIPSDPCLSQKKLKSHGDLIPFSNNVYSGDLKKRLGIASGIAALIQSLPEKKGRRYEAIYSFHLGAYGHISVKGEYLTYEDSYLEVTGGSGNFSGVHGRILLHRIVVPSKRYCTFYLNGIADLPVELICTPVPPSVAGEPAAAAENQADLKNCTD